MKEKFHETVLAAVISPLCFWYRKNQRILPWRENRDPYRIWVSEIMLQQTRVEAALPYYQRFLAALPDVYRLAEASEEQLLKLWEGLGYYSRVRNMQKAAQTLVWEYDGVFPQDVKALQSLSGIGDYTAGAIASIAFGLPEPAVDGNVLRVVSRLCDDDGDILLPQTKKRVKAALKTIYPLAEDCGDLTQALMELGALICIPGGQPRCEKCPVSSICLARLRGRTAELPVRIVKQEKKKTERTIFLLTHQGEIALSKRPDKGVLSGMWEFPGAEAHLSQAEAEEWLRKRSISGGVTPFVDSRHVFTHLIWDMKSYLVETEEKIPAFTWMTFDALRKETPLPSAMKPFFQALLKKTDH